MKKIFILMAAAAALMTVSCKKPAVTPDEPEKAPESVEIGGVVYKTVQLPDGSVWMAENLRYVPEGVTVSETPGDGAGIWYPYTSDGTNTTAVKDEATIKVNGYLYSYNKIFGEEINVENADKFEGNQGICPSGWHIPTRAEMVDFCGAATVKYGEEENAPTNENAVCWDAELKYGTIIKANVSGWNFVFSGAIANNIYQKLLTKSTTTDVDEFLGKVAMNYYACSTGHYTTTSAGVKSAKMSVIQTTFTGAYMKGRVSIADSDPAKVGVAVRCVWDKNAKDL